MNTKYKITIPEPCHEDWNKMIQDETGRFCSSCEKSVVDFTQMLPTEVQDFFIKNHGQKICGRFRTKQLDSIIIQIPNQVVFSQIHFHKMFLLALFICIGTTLFSCKQENGDKQKIEKIEVVSSDTALRKNITVGLSLPPKNGKHFDEIVLPPAPKRNQIKFLKNNKKDCIKQYLTSGEVIIEPIALKKTEDIIYQLDNIEVAPEYIGGITKFKNYVQNNYMFPKKSNIINGEVQASFVIEREGQLSTIKLIKDIDNGTGEVLVRLLNRSPKWIPGTQNGKPVRTKYFITLFVKTDTFKKSFFRTKLISKIDSIDIKQ